MLLLEFGGCCCLKTQIGNGVKPVIAIFRGRIFHHFAILNGESRVLTPSQGKSEYHMFKLCGWQRAFDIYIYDYNCNENAKNNMQNTLQNILYIYMCVYLCCVRAPKVKEVTTP